MTQPEPPEHSGKIRFGAFELDAKSRELHKHGVPIRLQQKPLQALTLLLEHCGEIVTRESMRRRLWGDDTFVEFDDSLNHTIKRLRDTLADSASNPRFIETVSGLGYRFVAPVEGVEDSAELRFRDSPPSTGSLRKMKWAAMPAAALLVVATVISWLGTSGGTSPFPASHSGAPAKPSLLVLPFTNLTGDPGQEFLADAMTDVLISELGKIGAFRVISRTSSMRYKEPGKSLPQIAEDLNVSHVLEGSILRSGGQIRITAQLIAAATDEHLWAENYVRDSVDIVTVQGDVAKSVVKAVHATITALSSTPL